MGSFYLVSTEDIKDFSDLVGKEVGNIGKGLTPDITVKAILKQKGINPDDINFTYVNSATDIIPLLATGKVTTGFVPEPALTVLMDKNPNLKIISNLNDVWKEYQANNHGRWLSAGIGTVKSAIQFFAPIPAKAAYANNKISSLLSDPNRFDKRYKNPTIKSSYLAKINNLYSYEQDK